MDEWFMCDFESSTTNEAKQHKAYFVFLILKFLKMFVIVDSWCRLSVNVIWLFRIWIMKWYDETFIDFLLFLVGAAHINLCSITVSEAHSRRNFDLVGK